jgi:K+-transporting ATPase ATPase A chain
MTLNGWLQILFFFALILAVTKPLGGFMARVFNRERTFLDPLLRPIERLIYRLTGVDEGREMRWTEYAWAMLLFSVVSMVVLYALQRMQAWLPFNPEKLANIEPSSSFNTAASFTTNTNWQSYVPEVTMSYLTQMAGLAYHNFVSAAVGIALAIAFIRGIARREQDTLGNFWVDMTRATLWVLLPFCLVGALALVADGVPQNLKPYTVAKIVDPQKVEKTDAVGKTTIETVTEQKIAQGPVASQEFIKEWGTNGGGFFNANSAHPYENPTPFTNLLEMFAIFAISAGLTYTLGRMTGSQKHGWAVFGAMTVLFFAGILVCYWAEARGNPIFPATVDQTTSAMQPGGNMEGKEARFGLANSTLWATITTDAGMYGILIYVVLSVFIAGLMVGRTPEYMGKKVEAYDVKMAMLNVLIFPLSILVFTAISSVSPGFGTSQLNNAGPHGLSEILYAFTSGTGNNGSAFAGISANTYWYNTTIGFAMLLGRFFMIIPMLALAGSLARKKAVPPSLGTFPVTTPLFTTLLVSVILIVGALTFFPALSLGPIVEHLLMYSGQVF